MTGPIFKNLVLDSTTSGGVGALTLLGASLGYQPASIIGAGNSAMFAIREVSLLGAPTGPFEVSNCTFSGGALTRNSVEESSNGGALVVFAAGTTKTVELVQSAAQVAAASTPSSNAGPITVGSATSSASTETLSFASGLETSLMRTMTTNVAYTIGSAPTGQDQRMIVDFVQDSTGGRVPTFPNVSWAGGTPPTFSTVAAHIDTVQFRAVGSYVLGFPVAMNQIPSAVPSAPTITATAGNAQNTINGGVSANPAVTGYNILRGTTSGSETQIAANVQLPYTDTSVTNGTNYFYKATAINNVGTGPQSNEVTATPSGRAPHAYWGFQVTSINGASSVELSELALMSGSNNSALGSAYGSFSGADYPTTNGHYLTDGVVSSGSGNHWYGPTASGTALNIGLPLSGAHAIDSIVLSPYLPVTDATALITGFNLYYSDDNFSTQHLALSVTSIPTTGWGTDASPISKTFALP